MKILRTLSAMLVPAFVVLAFTGCTDTQARLHEAHAKVAATLPAPHFEDLVTESVAIEGDRLVLLIRSPEGNAAKTRKAPGFETLKESEQYALRELCAQPAITPLIDTDAILVRRFVDRHGAVFFDVELPARACLTPPADAPVQP
ncbi:MULTISPECIES: hypothetical protein [unclassified Pseudoxanthomonas]|jgi:hypothetical protein|uniref:hypothetical protein n=1 Tax=unclassified Pseudoxanthomonas TaxID=2645906 RepID=UPI00307F628A